jgi:hypothetical protein
MSLESMVELIDSVIEGRGVGIDLDYSTSGKRTVTD